MEIILYLVVVFVLIIQSSLGANIRNEIVKRPRPSGIVIPRLAQFKNQDFYNLRSEWLKKGKLFEDPVFTKHAALMRSVTEDDIISNQIDQDDEYMRPKDIAKNAMFFVDGPSRFDVIQGDIMDCWFAASVSSLTLNRKLLRNVVPDDNSFQKDYSGIFHFRFWHYGNWTDVVVDDRLSVYYRNLDYMRSADANEFWSSLLEKAYAKVKGSYRALNGGEPEEALVDFTGGISLNFFLDEVKAPDSLFLKMVEASKADNMMTADVYPDDSWEQYELGIQQGHGYSVTKAAIVDYIMNGTTEIRQKRLVRVRNPYGSYVEWTGSWNEDSEEWNMVDKSVRLALEVKSRPDGEFWMPYEDFYRHFSILTIFHVPIAPSLDGQPPTTDWKLQTFEGEWIAGKSGGGANSSATFFNNPQHLITVAAPAGGNSSSNNTLFVGLMQKYRRETQKAMLPIGVSIYQLPDNEVLPDSIGADFFSTNQPIGSVEDPINGMREVSDTFSVHPGNYLLVPYTFLLKDNQRRNPKEDVKYMLRVFSKK